ncbi:hypothetical protein [Sinorhizobium glycinis]|nr:hypothetical protein [Sinorhizobium glycinis]
MTADRNLDAGLASAGTIDGMVPDGHPGFKGKINEKSVVTCAGR